MKNHYTPNTSEADLFSLNTPHGRRHKFNKRIDELTKPKSEGGPGLTINQAVFEMRTGGNADDQALFKAMAGLAKENADVSKASSGLAINTRRAAFNARITELMS